MARTRRARKAAALAPEVTPAPSSTRENEDTTGPVSLCALSRLPPEIWQMIGEVIQGQNTLRALVGTCRAFRDTFTPRLYLVRRFELQKLNPLRPRYIPLPPGVLHTKELLVAIFEFRQKHGSEGLKYEPKWMNDNYARYLARLIKELPNLQSLEWHDSAFEEFQTCLILRNKTLLKALKAAPKLERLVITYESIFDEDDPASYNCSVPLAGFRNLTTLEVYNIFGVKNRLVEDFTAVLSSCPGLKTLGIGLASNADWERSPEVMTLEGEGDFLEKLCLSYNAVSKSRPLSLHALKLGWGLCLFKSKSLDTGNFLELLAEAGNLQSLHLHNGYMQFGPDSPYQRMPVEWDLLGNCCSLRQLAVTLLTREVADWLNNVATDVKELILSDRTGMMYGKAQANLMHLNHPLSVLVAAEDGYRRVEDEDDDTDSSDTDMGSSDTDSIDSSISGTADSQPSENSASPRNGEINVTSLASMASSSLPVPNERIPKIPDEVATVLDHLKDGGIHLSHLTLSLDLNEQWVNFTTKLAALKCLTHIRVERRTWKYGPWPNADCSLWHGVDDPKQIALRFAQALKTICCTIQFVQFHDWAWQFIPQRDVSKVIEGDPESRYEALELEWDEIKAIPLFSKDLVNTNAGISADCLHIPEEQDWVGNDRINDLVEARIAEWRALRDEEAYEDDYFYDYW